MVHGDVVAVVRCEVAIPAPVNPLEYVQHSPLLFFDDDAIAADVLHFGKIVH